MAHSAHETEEKVKEHYDSAEEVERKCQLLAKMIKESKHMVAFTGAGISTSAGIPDFRGPTGTWTRKAKGLKPLKGTSSLSAHPTATHMSLVKLEQEGVLKYLISQNCDGLHVRSGFNQSKLSELHGNGNKTICELCGQSYFYDAKCPVKKDFARFKRDRWTGKYCLHNDCGGRQLKTTICFGQDLPDEPLRLAEDHSEKADFHLALGSSLTVTPAADCPQTTAWKDDGKLVIINLQVTPLTKDAEFQIYAKTDDVMKRVMELLQYEIPSFRLRRKLVCGVEPNGKGLYVRGVDADDLTLEHRYVKAATWSKPKLGELGFDHTGQIVESAISDNGFGIPFMPCEFMDKMEAQQKVHVDVTLEFFGHYDEPDLIVTNDFTEAYRSQQRVEYLWSLELDPIQKEWSVSAELSTIPKETKRVKDNSFGKLCAKYVTDFLVEKGYSQSQANKKWNSYVRRHSQNVDETQVAVYKKEQRNELLAALSTSRS